MQTACGDAVEMCSQAMKQATGGPYTVGTGAPGGTEAFVHAMQLLVDNRANASSSSRWASATPATLGCMSRWLNTEAGVPGLACLTPGPWMLQEPLTVTYTDTTQSTTAGTQLYIGVERAVTQWNATSSPLCGIAQFGPPDAVREAFAERVQVFGIHGDNMYKLPGR